MEQAISQYIVNEVNKFGDGMFQPSKTQENAIIFIETPIESPSPVPCPTTDALYFRVRRIEALLFNYYFGMEMMFLLMIISSCVSCFVLHKRRNQTIVEATDVKIEHI